MTFTILFSIILAKIRGYRILPAFKSWTLFPFYASELFYLFLQFNIFTENYSYVKYAALFKAIHIYTMLVPIVVYKLYRPALAGSALILSGTALNKWVIYANAGKMPVFPTLSYLTGYATPEAFGKDSLHILGSSATHLKILSDYIDTGFSILSVGDLLIHSFFFVILFYTIKAASEKIKK